MSTKLCQVEHCPHWDFAGGLCKKHAALKLLSLPSHSSGKKPTPMQLYRKTVNLTSASRAHYDAVLYSIDQAISAHNSPQKPIEEQTHAADALGDAAPTARRLQLSPPLTRSTVARWAAPHETLYIDKP